MHINMLLITENIQLPLSEISLKAIRAKGPGGQHVNKVSSALQLTFDITASSLPVDIKERLLSLNDHRISKEGVITIKAQDSRSQIQNKEIAFNRLKEMILQNLKPQKLRRPTKPTKSSIKKIKEDKKRRSEIKAMRKKVEY